MPSPFDIRAVGQDFCIALVGEGQLIQPFVDVLSSAEMLTHMPWLKLCAVCVLDDAAIEWGGLPIPAVHDDPYTLRETYPDLQLVINLQRREGDTSCPQPCIDAHAAALFLTLLQDTAHSKACATDLQYANSLFRTIFEEVEEDIILLDTNGIIVDTNKNVYQRKSKSRDDIVGLHCWEVEGSRFCCDGHEQICPFKNTLRTGKKSEQVHSYVDDNGRMRYFRVYTYPMFDSFRNLSHIMEIRRDITNRTNMEIRLQQSEKMAAIGELATYIAHEIRNPLFAIGGFANSLLRAPSLDETAREKVTIILQESKRLDTILKSILNFARPTDSRQSIVDINKVAAETMEVMRIGCQNRGIETVLAFDDRIAKVKGDGEMLKQCLINMIKNAMEAMPKGGTLTMRTSMTRTHVRLEVIDTGRGIPRELRDKVFNPFFSTKEQGAGLGLPMTKKIIEEMGGKVELHSREGKGTRIVLDLLPLLAIDEQDQELRPPQGS